MEGDAIATINPASIATFQSTPSAWRETFRTHPLRTYGEDFNPLPPHGGRHARKNLTNRNIKFQSTPSAWRETIRQLTSAIRQRISIHSLRMEGDQDKYPLLFILDISIHSLRMEGDLGNLCYNNPKAHFNPLPPHGGRPAADAALLTMLLFQSTPSAWRETEVKVTIGHDPMISIHSLRMEGDAAPNVTRLFHVLISIHSLRMEGDEC